MRSISNRRAHRHVRVREMRLAGAFRWIRARNRRRTGAIWRDGGNRGWWREMLGRRCRIHDGTSCINEQARVVTKTRKRVQSHTRWVWDEERARRDRQGATGRARRGQQPGVEIRARGDEGNHFSGAIHAPGREMAAETMPRRGWWTRCGQTGRHGRTAGCRQTCDLGSENVPTRTAT